MNIEIPVMKYCPVTGNMPLTCTRKGFTRSCEKFQRAAESGWTSRTDMAGNATVKDYCLICRGTVPGEVTFIGLEKLKKERKSMSGTSFVKGTCELCGKTKNVATHYEKKVCNTCIALRTGAKNSPDLLITALQEFGNMPEMQEKKVVVEKVDLGALEPCEILKIRATDAEDEALELSRENEDLREDVVQLNRIVSALKEELRNSSQVQPKSLDKDVRERINGIAWKLADSIQDGAVAVNYEDVLFVRSLQEVAI